MFETEPIIYLQSLGTPLFTFLMIMITKMGSYAFLTGITAMIIFGMDFRKGFLLLQLLLWTFLIVELLKIMIAFPRPDFVDNRVLNLEYGTNNTSPFTGNLTEGFPELPDRGTLAAFRLQEAFAYSPFGFPSGHTALTTAFWGGCATLFKSRKIWLLAPFAILLIAFSRVYLGRHFIAGVTGGFLTGIVMLLIFTYLLRSPLKDDLFERDSFELAFRRQNVIFYSFMFIVPAILTAISLVPPDIAGFFLGTNVAYFLILRKGIPDETGTVRQRIARVSIALLLLGVSAYILNIWMAPAGTVDYLRFTLFGFMEGFIPAMSLWVSVVLCTRLGLYRS